MFGQNDKKTQRQKLKERAARLYKQGVSTTAIAVRLGFSSKTIRRWVTEVGNDSRP